jgi:hypothetical protein
MNKKKLRFFTNFPGKTPITIIVNANGKTQSAGGAEEVRKIYIFR